jgi:hypothetical protein
MLRKLRNTKKQNTSRKYTIKTQKGQGLFNKIFGRKKKTINNRAFYMGTPPKYYNNTKYYIAKEAPKEYLMTTPYGTHFVIPYNSPKDYLGIILSKLTEESVKNKILVAISNYLHSVCLQKKEQLEDEKQQLEKKLNAIISSQASNQTTNREETIERLITNLENRVRPEQLKLEKDIAFITKQIYRREGDKLCKNTINKYIGNNNNNKIVNEKFFEKLAHELHKLLLLYLKSLKEKMISNNNQFIDEYVNYIISIMIGFIIHFFNKTKLTDKTNGIQSWDDYAILAKRQYFYNNNTNFNYDEKSEKQLMEKIYNYVEAATNLKIKDDSEKLNKTN